MLANKGLKACSACKTRKPATAKHFCRNRCTQDGFQNVCKPCKAKINKNWKYALASGQFDRMLQEQQGLCAICSEPMLDPVLDHDHALETIRQLLCRKCNALLGMANDNVTVLQRAIAYLNRFREQQAC